MPSTRGMGSKMMCCCSFKVTARDLGNLRPGLSLDNIAELIEHVEGPLHR
jgi:hypothetical protein